MFGVAPVSMLCAVGLASLALDVVDPGHSADPAAVVDPGPRAPEPLSQEGILIAVSADSVTARSADRHTQTYCVTPNTTVIVGRGSQPAPAIPHFAVNEHVEIVGTVIRGGTALATAVADRDSGHGDGPPMDDGDGWALPAS
jgi:hypothetical protein